VYYHVMKINLKVFNMTKFTLSNPLYSRKEAADYLGVKLGTLNNWASTKKYPLKFIKVGRLAKYRQEDLDEFLERRTVNVEEKIKMENIQ